MELHHLLYWYFLLAMIRSRVAAQGPGWCWNTVSSVISVRESYIETATKRTATCCNWMCDSQCSTYRLSYRTAFRDALRVIYKLDLGCCPSWRPVEGSCIPANMPNHGRADGRVEATLIPFHPAVPPGAKPGTKTFSGLPDGPSKPHLAVGSGRSESSGPRLPSLESAPEGDVYVVKTSRQSAWARSHPFEMTGIVGFLVFVMLVMLIGWSVYRRRIMTRDLAMVRISKDDSFGNIEAMDFKYDYAAMMPSNREMLQLPTSTRAEHKRMNAPSTSVVRVIDDYPIYQNFPPFKPMAARFRREDILEDKIIVTRTHRDSVYEISLQGEAEGEATPKYYTKLNVGDRQADSAYMPLKVSQETEEEKKEAGGT